MDVEGLELSPQTPGETVDSDCRGPVCGPVSELRGSEVSSEDIRLCEILDQWPTLSDEIKNAMYHLTQIDS
jgi:hypothetical protein